MNENRYQSGEEPRIGDLVERVIENLRTPFPVGTRGKVWYSKNGFIRLLNFQSDRTSLANAYKLIERADPGCPYKIGDTLSHAGSKRTGVVQEFKRYVHPTTKEVRYHAIVKRVPSSNETLKVTLPTAVAGMTFRIVPNGEGRLRSWDLRRCSLATPAEQPERYPYYVVNAKGNPWRWMGDNVEGRDYYVIRVLGPRSTEYLFNDKTTRFVSWENLNCKHYLRNGLWKRVNANPFDTQSKYWTGHAGDGDFNNPANWKYQPADERGPITAVPGSTAANPFIGVRSDTGEAVRESDLKQEPTAFTECESCRAKPGSPQLCDGCLYRRTLHSFNELADKYSHAESRIANLITELEFTRQERTKLAADFQTRHDELKQQLDTVTKDRDAVLDRNKTQMESIRRIRSERDEATQAADKLQTQLNELRDELKQAYDKIGTYKIFEDALKSLKLVLNRE